ncbi:hypothetical protein GCM10027292_29180 [Hydrogenophaga aquatica]
MARAKLLLPWLLRAWPVLALLPIIACHYAAVQVFPAHAVLVNKLTGTALQIVGGIIVLLAIDGNLGLFRKQTLYSVVIEWFRDFPLIRRNVTIALSGVSSSSATASATLSVERRFTTVEERVAELERQIKELHTTIAQQKAALLGRIEEVKAELGKGLATNQAAIQELSARIETSAVGGFKQQGFGVLLAIYGAIVSVFA